MSANQQSAMARWATTLAAMAALAAAPLAQAVPSVLWDQGDFSHGTGAAASSTLPLHDFVLAAPTAVSGFRVWMRDNIDSATAYPGDGLANGVFTDFSGVLSWYLFADSGGTPGALLASGDALAPLVVDTGENALPLLFDDIFEVTVDFAAPVNLAAGRTWLGVREGLRGSAMDGSQVLWMAASANQGATGWFFADGQNQADLQGPAPLDSAFQILGTQAVPEPGGGALVVLALALALLLPRVPGRGARRGR